MTKRRQKLNGDELFDTIRRLHKDPEAISEHATSEMILAGIVDVREVVAGIDGKVDDLAEEMKTLKENEIAHLSADVNELKKNWDDNPSLLYLLRYKTTSTIKVLLVIAVVVVFALMTVWFNPAFQQSLLEFLNIPYVPSATP